MTSSDVLSLVTVSDVLRMLSVSERDAVRIFVSFQFTPEKRIPVGVLSDFGRDTVFEGLM